MNRLRRNTRIRPFRPYWSRPMLLSVYLAGALVVFWAGTAWLQRSASVTLELDPAGPYVIRSSAGPIELTGSAPATAPPSRGDRRSTFEYDASWLLFGPDVLFDPDISFGPDAQAGAEPEARSGIGPGRVEVSCETRFPCRAVSRLRLPQGQTSVVTIESLHGDISVNAFVGDLAVVAAGSAGAYLGSVGGRVSVESQEGDVAGYGLNASEMEVETTSGTVELDFAARPRSLVVRSESGPVTIVLPDGDYAVSVEGRSSTAINVGQAANADSKIQIHARGPVRIDPTR